MVTKRQAVLAAFGNLPQLDSQFVDFLFPRRHLAKAPDPHFKDAFEPQYIADYFELEEAITKTLDKIRQRDGVEIFDEVREGLIGWLQIKDAI